MNYYNKPLQSEYLLSYIKIIHKAMTLTAREFEVYIYC